MQAKRDYYQILGVARNARESDIKKSYRQLALKFHPDRNPGNREAEERFKEASEAFQVLSDPDKRRTYDQFGFEGLEGAGYTGVGGIDDIFTHFEDLFGDFFGFGFGGFKGRPRAAAPVQGRSIQKGVEITLQESAAGCKREIAYRLPTPCEACGGHGMEPGTSAQSCPTCNGRGQVTHAQGVFMLSTTCPHCGGRGQLNTHPCKACHGQGQVMHDRTVVVSLPPGIDDGQSIRVPNHGEPGGRGGPPGHLFVEVRVIPDPRFRREHDDLYADIDVPYPMAVLGGKVKVATLDGAKDAKLHPGTQPGETILLKHMGMPKIDGKGRGHLYGVVRIAIPTKVSRRQKKLLQELLQIEKG